MDGWKKQYNDLTMDGWMEMDLNGWMIKGRFEWMDRKMI